MITMPHRRLGAVCWTSQRAHKRMNNRITEPQPDQTRPDRDPSNAQTRTERCRLSIVTSLVQLFSVCRVCYVGLRLGMGLRPGLGLGLRQRQRHRLGLALLINTSSTGLIMELAHDMNMAMQLPYLHLYLYLFCGLLHYGSSALAS